MVLPGLQSEIEEVMIARNALHSIHGMVTRPCLRYLKVHARISAASSGPERHEVMSCLLNPISVGSLLLVIRLDYLTP